MIGRLKDPETDKASIQQVYAILGDPCAQKVLSAWGCAVRLKLTKEKPPADLDALWAFGWRNCEIDEARLCRATGLSDKIVKEQVARLQDLRLVYPDGTITEPARKLLASIVARELGLREKKRKEG